MDKFLFTFSIFVAIFFSYFSVKKDNKKLLIFPIAIFSLLAGLRAKSVGVDTSAYYYAFETDFSISWQFEETGFRIISKMLMNILNNPIYLMIIYAFITNFLIISRLWDFRKKCNFTLMIFLYGFIYFIETMNIMRQFIAISIIFYSTKLLEKNRYLLFVLIVCGTTMIHKSSLMALLFVLIYLWKNLNKSQKMLAFFPITIISLISLKFVLGYESGHIDNYLSSSNSFQNFNLTFIYRFIVFLFSLFMYKSNKVLKIKKDSFFLNNTKYFSEKDKFNFKIIILNYFVGFCFSSLGMFFVVMARVGYFYLIFEIVYWGYLTSKISRNKNINTVMISIYAIYIYILEILRNGSGIFPYSFNL